VKEENSLVPTVVYSNNSFHFKSHTTPSSKSRFGDLCVWNSEDAAKTVDDRFVARNNIEAPRRLSHCEASTLIDRIERCFRSTRGIPNWATHFKTMGLWVVETSREVRKAPEEYQIGLHILKLWGCGLWKLRGRRKKHQRNTKLGYTF
jgi:hypothetical protein